jgi:hypothetical protein
MVVHFSRAAGSTQWHSIGEFGAGNACVEATLPEGDAEPLVVTFAAPQAAGAVADWYGISSPPALTIPCRPDSGTHRDRWTGQFARSLHRASPHWHARLAGVPELLPRLDAVGHPEYVEGGGGLGFGPLAGWPMGYEGRYMPFLPAAHAAWPWRGEFPARGDAPLANTFADEDSNYRATALRLTLSNDPMFVPLTFSSGTSFGSTVVIPSSIFAGASVDVTIQDGAWNEYRSDWVSLPANAVSSFSATRCRAAAALRRIEGGDWWEATDPDAATHTIANRIDWSVELEGAFTVNLGIPPTPTPTAFVCHAYGSVNLTPQQTDDLAAGLPLDLPVGIDSTRVQAIGAVP